MAYFLAPIANDQQCDSNGAPLSGGFIYTYLAGSSSAYPTYTDNTGVTPQANPIVLNTLGLPPSPVWLQSGTAYKYIIRDSLGVLQRTIDNVSGINDATVSVSQWVTFGATPTYISGTSFSVAGDQTGTFQVGRRVQCTVTAGTVYGTITASVFGTVTTVTVTMDSGALDSGLSVVAVGLLTSINPSLPSIYLPSSGGVVTGTLGVTGATTLSSTLGVTGAATLSSTLAVTGAITPSQTNGIVGTTTNNNANAGSVGEEIRSDIVVGSAVSLVSAAAKNVTSISLTAGDWDVNGIVNFHFAATTSVTGLFGGSSLTTGAFDSYQFSHRCAAFAPGALDMGYTIPVRRLSLSVTTTVYLVATAGFTVDVCSAWGFISARRRR